jgi:predicted alpha/beta superfamily hydrolase
MKTLFTQLSLVGLAKTKKFTQIATQLILLPILFINQVVFANDIIRHNVPQIEVNLGEEITFYSENLKKQREFFIRLPDSYEIGKRKYPVIYLLDANNEILTYMDNLYFHSVTQIERLMQNGDIPESIIVGIPFKSNQWFSNVASNSKPFRNYLNKELSKHINDNYRTINNNILIGQSYSATFVINTLPNSSDIFNSYIAIEPILPNNAFENTVRNYQNISVKSSDLQIILGGELMLPETEALREKIISSTGKTVNISLEVFPAEDHDSVYYPALNLGLRNHFADYRQPTKDQVLSTNFDHQALLNHFEKRAKKYKVQTSDKQFNDAIFLVIYHQLIAKKFDQAFALWPLWISPNKLYNANRAIDHFLRNGDNISAISLLQHLAIAMPNSVSILDRLTTLYLENQKLEQVRKYRLKVQLLLTKIFSKPVSDQQENDLNTYGYSLLSEQRVQEAITVFKRITQAKPSSINAYDSLAEAYETAKNFPEAIKTLEQAIAVAQSKNDGNIISFEQKLRRLKNIKM